MKSFFLTLFFLSLIAENFSQSINISARSTYIINRNHNSKNINELGITLNEQHYQSKSYLGDITTEYLKNGISHRISIGIQKQNSNSYNIGYTTINKEKRIFEYNAIFTQYHIGCGISKSYSSNKFTFNTGVEIPLFITNINLNNNTITSYDNNGFQYETIILKSQNPLQYTSGLNFFANYYYNFWKSFSLGIEIANYFLYSKAKGITNEENNTYDKNNNLIKSATKKKYTNYSGFNTDFLFPYFGISYKFTVKNNPPKEEEKQ